MQAKLALIGFSSLLLSGVLTAATSEAPQRTYELAHSAATAAASTQDSVITQFYFADPGRHKNKVINYTLESSKGELSSSSGVLHPSDCVVLADHDKARFCHQRHLPSQPSALSKRVAPTSASLSSFHTSPARTAGMLTHVIQQGENLNTIVSLYYGDPSDSAQVAAFNQLSPEEAKTLQPGETLKIPVKIKLSASE